jgi:DNA-directed RNA polymerase specialized sigma24 family protein
MTGAGDKHMGDDTSSTSLSLLERARGSDVAAWGRLVGLYTPLVDRWCRQAGLQDADAADIRQEVFVAVARGLAAFRRKAKNDTFRGWLRVITRHKLCDYWRRRPPGQAAGAVTPSSSSSNCRPRDSKSPRTRRAWRRSICSTGGPSN